eukprot:TRINITY_DN28550_c0_g1_i1.p1 TRINITY_DN28550_c0_g1~~TRINITY_DN28550_c0_g1_i1.p1  ORF type:complete len:373 (+),score=108.71 TRINITY_DN28550_c0_g1_i1:64-1182(+)
MVRLDYRPGGAEDQEVHVCWKKKRILRKLEERGWDLVPGSEPGPSAGLCFQQKTNGCKCGADWKMFPRRAVDCLGAKTALAKLLGQSQLAHLCPTTFVSLKDFRQYLMDRRRRTFWKHEEEGDEYGKWYVKISHLNARQGVRCFSTAEDAEDYAENLSKSEPRWLKYVLQAEIPNPVTIDGHKVMLRCWSCLTVSRDGVHLNISRRLRVNRMLSKFGDDSNMDSNVLNSEQNAFDDSSDWPLYQPLWEDCARAVEKVVGGLLRRWERDAAVRPPPVGDGGPVGWYNLFGFDFVPTYSKPWGTAGAPGAALVEVNVDPSVCHKCTETTAFAEDWVDAFAEGLTVDGQFAASSDDMFHTVHLDYKPNVASSCDC